MSVNFLPVFRNKYIFLAQVPVFFSSTVPVAQFDDVLCVSLSSTRDRTFTSHKQERIAEITQTKSLIRRVDTLTAL